MKEIISHSYCHYCCRFLKKMMKMMIYLSVLFCEVELRVQIQIIPLSYNMYDKNRSS